MAQRAVFLDRDNTIIADPGYINDPDQVHLLPGAAEAIQRLNAAGYVVVVATNQSGVARGRITEKQLAAVHQRMREMLLEQGARLDAIYYCPYLPGVDATVPRFRRESRLRKPEPGMLLKAAQELELSLEASWMIGDSTRDILAGRRAGCRTILIAPPGKTLPEENCHPDFKVASLAEAVEIVLSRPDRAAPSPPAPEAAAPAPSAAAAPSAAPAKPDELNTTLQELRNVLRRLERDGRQDDFSVARLLATLAQMLALAAGAWGVAQLASGKGATDWLIIAVLLQLVVLTAMAGRRH